MSGKEHQTLADYKGRRLLIPALATALHERGAIIGTPASHAAVEDRQRTPQSRRSGCSASSAARCPVRT